MHIGTTPLWLKNGETHDFANLREDVSCDVCIVGGGITGLVAAYELSRSGSAVIVVDDGPIAGGETMRTTAHLSSVLDRRFVDLTHMHERRDLIKVVKDHIEAIDHIEELIQREGISCDFARVPGRLFALDAEGSKPSQLQAELDAMHGLGLTEATLQGDRIQVPRQAQLHPLKYAAGLIAAIERNGGRFFTHTHISDLKSDDNKCTLTANNDCTITADWVLVATGSPVFESPVLDTKLAAYRTYVIACELLDPADYADHDALMWSCNQDSNPFHYIRSQTIDIDGVTRRYMTIGGGDHRVGHKQNYDEIFDELETFARKLGVDLGPIEYRWSGQVVEPVDGLPFIGRATNLGDRVLIATGMSGMGMTQSAIAARVCSDIILAHDESARQAAIRDHAIYALERKRLSATGDYIKENWSTACQYLDHLNLVAQTEDPGEMPEDEGAVITHNLNKVAIYKGTNGMIRACQAVCPHAKAIIRWNALEKSFDCPAHGSRFSCTGEVIDGPANSDLPAQELTSTADPSQALGFSLGAKFLATDS